MDSKVDIVNTSTLSIESAFKSFYAIPEFQREYVWKKANVTRLLDDVFRAYRDGSVDSYFLGSIVYYEEDQAFDLVDGQQRVITLFLIISAIRDRLKALDDTWDVRVYEEAIKAPHKKKGKGTGDRYRVELQYPDLSKILQRVGDGEGPEMVVPKANALGYNLINAYRICENFLKERFSANAEDLDEFHTFLWNDVLLIGIQTKDIESAFTTFETINDRGAGLDAMDLLKNLLFREVPREDRDLLAQRWSEVLQLLRDCRESRPIRFLRYFLVANYEFDRVPSSKMVFEWISRDENKRKLGWGKKPLKFVDKLVGAAEEYSNFAQGLNRDGTVNPNLQGINFQKTGVRQHLCLLLACQGLSEAAFRTLCSAIESLVFVLAMAGAQWNEIERALPEWTAALRNAKTQADVDSFVKDKLDPLTNNYSNTFFERLENSRDVPRRLQKYILASVTQQLEIETGKKTAYDLDHYYKENLTIEHVYPQTPGSRAKKDFGPVSDPEKFIYRLGNLTLLHRSPNSSGQNKTFSEKKSWYHKSIYELTKSLVDDIGGGKATKPRKAKTKYQLDPFTAWNPKNVEKRHKSMMLLADATWHLPKKPGT